MEPARSADDILGDIKSQDEGPERLKATVRVLEKITSDSEETKRKCEKDSKIIDEARKAVFGNAEDAERGLYYKIKNFFSYVKTYILGEKIDEGLIARLEKTEKKLKDSTDLLEDKIAVNEEAYQKMLQYDKEIEINILNLQLEYEGYNEEKSAKIKEIEGIKTKISETENIAEIGELTRNKIGLEREIEKTDSLMNICAEAAVFYNQVQEINREVYLPNWNVNIEQFRESYYNAKLQLERTKKTKECIKMNFEIVQQNEEVNRHIGDITAIANELDMLLVKVSSNSKDSKQFFKSLNSKDFGELKKLSAVRKTEMEGRSAEYRKAAENIWQTRKQYH